MFILKNEIEFDSAHYLEGHHGKCANIHGHRYKLIVKIKGAKLKETGSRRGMIEDFSYIKQILKEVQGTFDHKLIIEDNIKGRALVDAIKSTGENFEFVLVPYRPTAEEMSRHIFNIIKDKGLDIHEVELYETPGNSCIYSEDI
ncbi:MAG: 6-carboxytetrahydropterin synthase QueD [Solirubrobacterales bacterium]